MLNRTGRQEPAAERLEGPVGLVDRRSAEAPLPKSGEKPRHWSRGECREVVADLDAEMIDPGPVGAERCRAATADLLAEQERLTKIGERVSFGSERLLFCDFRSVLIARNALFIKIWRARQDSNLRPTA